MESPQRQLDQLLFAFLPYVAVVTFLVLVAARRWRLPPFGLARQPAVPLVRQPSYGERVLLSYGLLLILGGHALAFLIPQQVLLWNTSALRLYILEVFGLVFGLMTLVGLVLTVARCLFSAESRQRTSPCDWLLYFLLMLEVGNGIFLALFYPWGSSWYATSAVPYLRSLGRLEPDISYISSMPLPVKLHIVNAFLLLALLPFTQVVRPLVEREPDKTETGIGNPLVTTVLLVGLGFSLLALIPRLQASHLPGNDQGYEPVQPLAFSHRLHAGDMQISCLYCHFAADKSPHAGIPAATVCMNCHRFVSAPLQAVRAEYEQARQEKRPARTLVTPELQKLYDALGLDDKLQPDRSKPLSLIHWVQVHNLPAFTRFDHRAHVNAEIACQRCHGPVETMERVRQIEDLSMGWCVNCHRNSLQSEAAGRELRPSNDCATCHH
jgi:respiratory nitrate reductase gamma subunit